MTFQNLGFKFFVQGRSRKKIKSDLNGTRFGGLTDKCHIFVWNMTFIFQFLVIVFFFEFLCFCSSFYTEFLEIN